MSIVDYGINGHNTKVGVFTYMRASDWSLVIFKFLLGIGWPIGAVVNPSLFLQDAVSWWFIVGWSIPTFFGGIVSILGQIMASQPSIPLSRARIRTLGVTVEFIGLCFLSVGPLAYCGTFIGVYVSGSAPWNVGIVIYSLSMVTVMAHFAIKSFFRVRREAQDTRKVIKPRTES